MNKQVLAVFSVLSIMLVLLLTASASAAEYNSVKLAEISQNSDLPIVQRVNATIELGYVGDTNAVIAIGRATRDDVALLRLAAIQAVHNWQDVARWDMISPLLNDDVAEVRYDAALAVLRLWPSLNTGQQQVIDMQIEAYILTLPTTIDGLLEQAYLYRIRTNYQQAESVFTLLLDREAENTEHQNAIYLEYVELLKSTDRNLQAITLLENVVQVQPESSELYFSLGLAYYREGDLTTAIANIKTAHTLNNDDAQINYLLALLIKDAEPQVAVDLLSKAYEVNKQATYLYSLCELQLQLKQDASRCLAELGTLIPKQIVDDLVLAID